MQENITITGLVARIARLEQQLSLKEKALAQAIIELEENERDTVPRAAADALVAALENLRVREGVVNTIVRVNDAVDAYRAAMHPKTQEACP